MEPDAATTFPSEIEAMPEALLRLVSSWEGHAQARGAAWLAFLRGIRRVVVLGMGTSSFALLTVGPGLACRGSACHGEDAGEWLHSGSVLAEGELAVLCSQSGSSAEVVRLLERPWLVRPCGVTNELGSPLAQACAPVFPLSAGEERSISAKTYANTLATGHLLGAVSRSAVDPWIVRLRRAAQALQASLHTELVSAVDALCAVDGLAVIGRTHALPAARQLALTLGEGAGMGAVPFTGGGFRHGPLEACGPRNGVVAFAGCDAAGALVLRVCAEARALGSPVVVFTDRKDVPAGCITVPIPAEADVEDISLRASVLQTRFVQSLAAARGRKAGVFRVVAKVTSEE